MAIAVTGVQDISSSGTTTALTIPASTTAVCLIIYGAATNTITSGSSLDIGGVSLTNLHAFTAGGVQSAGSMWWSDDISGRTDDTLTHPFFSGGDVAPTYFSATTPALRTNSGHVDNEGGLGPITETITVNADASVPVAGANQLIILHHYQRNGVAAYPGGTTAIIDAGATHGAGYQLGADDAAVQAQVSTTGGQFWSWYHHVVFYESEVSFHVGLTVTLPGVTITGPGDIFAHLVQKRLVVTLPGVTCTAPSPMELAIVGRHTEMTGRAVPGAGLTTPVLSHDTTRPVYIEGSTIVPARTRMVPLTTTEAAGDPEFVWDDDDQLVMTEFYE